MKALFYVFSGTGNTEKICRSIYDIWKEKGVDCKYIKLQKDCEIANPREYDRIIIGYPVHAFNAPQPMLKFLKTFPRYSGNALVYFIKTSGEPLRLNDGSCARPYSILKKRSYSVAGEYHYVMPYNMIFRHSDGMAARMWRAAKIRLPIEAEEMLQGKRKKLPKTLPKRAFSAFMRIEQVAMPILGRFFKTTDACNSCGKCAAVCPMKNIKMENDTPAFGKECIGCTRCSFGCPKDAIKIGVLNGWRVNGAYSYDGEPATDEQICRYCRHSYKRYFHEAECLADRFGEMDICQKPHSC